MRLPGHTGRVRVEFIVDTGFDGELALPPSALSEVAAALKMRRSVLLADGPRQIARRYGMVLDWFEEEREVEVIELQGRPLIGGLLLEGCQISIEMRDGGEVMIEPS